MNYLVRQDELDELRHYGVIGMKWRQRRAAKKTNKLDKKVTKNIRRFDKGKKLRPGTLTGLSSDIRKHKYKINKKIKRAQKFLNKAALADARTIVNRYNRNPEKRVAVQKYVDSLKSNVPTLDELRLQLIDVRI